MEDIQLKINFSSMLDSFVCFLGVGKGCKFHYVILWMEFLLEVTKDLYPVFFNLASCNYYYKYNHLCPERHVIRFSLRQTSFSCESGVFSLRDMYEQFQNIMKMGPFGQIMVSSLFEVDINGRECFISYIINWLILVFLTWS